MWALGSVGDHVELSFWASVVLHLRARLEARLPWTSLIPITESINNVGAPLSPSTGLGGATLVIAPRVSKFMSCAKAAQFAQTQSIMCAKPEKSRILQVRNR